MVSLKPVIALVAALVLTAGAAAQVQAEEEVVTVTASRAQEAAVGPACEGMSRGEAARVAREAEKKAAYQQASECFLVAGEYLRAHRASARAAGEGAAAVKRNASAAAGNAKAQAARLRAAFR